jgi:integrase
MPDRFRIVLSTPYAAGDRARTARLCVWTDGRKSGGYFVYFETPRGGGWHKRRVSLRTRDEAAARKRYGWWVADLIPAEVEAAIRGRDDTLGDDNPLLGDLATWYTDTHQVARGDVAGTRAENRRVFGAFLEYCAARDILTVDDLAAEPHAADEYVAELCRAKRPRTVRKEVTKLRALFRAAAARWENLRQPVRQWPMPEKPEPEFPEPHEPAELQALLARLRNGTDARSGMADGRSSLYNVVRFLCYVGCRPSDACGLTRDRLRLDSPRGPEAVIRQQKTGQLVAVALSPEAEAAVREELARGIASEYVFTDRHGKPIRPATLTTTMVHHCKQMSAQPITPKTFRQTAVSYLLDAGADKALVRRVTGHHSEAMETYRRLRAAAPHEAARTLAAKLGCQDAEPTPQSDDH